MSEVWEHHGQRAMFQHVSTCFNMFQKKYSNNPNPEFEVALLAAANIIALAAICT